MIDKVWNTLREAFRLPLVVGGLAVFGTTCLFLPESWLPPDARTETVRGYTRLAVILLWVVFLTALVGMVWSRLRQMSCRRAEQARILQELETLTPSEMVHVVMAGALGQSTLIAPLTDPDLRGLSAKGIVVMGAGTQSVLATVFVLTPLARELLPKSTAIAQAIENPDCLSAAFDLRATMKKRAAKTRGLFG